MNNTRKKTFLSRLSLLVLALFSATFSHVALADGNPTDAPTTTDAPGTNQNDTQKKGWFDDGMFSWGYIIIYAVVILLVGGFVIYFFFIKKEEE